MARRTAVILILSLISLACSSGGGGGSDSTGGVMSSASCQLSHSAINFGIAPLNDIDPCNAGGVGNVTVMIQNTGTTTISDSIAFTHNASNPTNAPVFRLQSGQSSSFTVAPGGTLGVVVQTLACRTTANSGLYQGSASFGSTCGSVALSLTVSEM